MRHGSVHPEAIARVVPIDNGPAVEAALVSFAAAPGPAILESSAVDPSYGRFSIFCDEPVATLAVAAGEHDPIGKLAEAMRTWPGCRVIDRLPFAGGWVGYISYEAGLTVEGITERKDRDIGLPALRFGLYDTAAVYEHATGQWFVVGVAWPEGCALRRPPVGERIERMSQRLASAVEPAPLGAADGICDPPVPNMSRGQYLARVERIKRYIEAGDVYQVNFTQRFATTTTATPVDLYRRLRAANPAAYSALLLWDDRAVISSSPELFLDVRRREVVTRPIKGTRPRIGDEAVDRTQRLELMNSEKDRAELAMIVDLLRNDLGRVCEFGSIRVVDPAELETHPTVYHLVGEIAGRLRGDCSTADLLRATFPGGSITGAPKIRAMEIIEELEETQRSVYCGAIGLLGLDGGLSLNVAIRTMIQTGRRLHLFAGGGIVADSEPAAEYEESLAKAAGMLRALGHESIARPPAPDRAMEAYR